MADPVSLSRRTAFIGMASAAAWPAWAQPTAKPAKTVRIIVALVDNQHQGIVPVPPLIGNGQDARNNLYWGALYGVKTHFRKSPLWAAADHNMRPRDGILDRARFTLKDRAKPYTLTVTAEAWAGDRMTDAITEFYDGLSGPDAADLTVFVGHNGLMDAPVTAPRLSAQTIAHNRTTGRAAIILACYSDRYFSDTLRAFGVEPLVMTTGLMAPEAYSLDPAIRSWADGGDANAARTAAAAGYAKYQKIPLRNAKRLFGAQ